MVGVDVDRGAHRRRADSLVETLRHELRGPAGDQVLYATATLEELANGTLAEQRFLVLLFGVFAGVAMMLAFIGIYGVLVYPTGQRVPEFGVRMALGATARDVVRLVLGESARMIAAGAMLARLPPGPRGVCCRGSWKG